MKTVREVIGLMVSDVLKTTRANLAILSRLSGGYPAGRTAVIGFSPEMAQHFGTLRAFLTPACTATARSTASAPRRGRS